MGAETSQELCQRRPGMILRVTGTASGLDGNGDEEKTVSRGPLRFRRLLLAGGWRGVSCKRDAVFQV